MENIIDILDNRIKNVRTKSLDISFNELLDMYKNKELIIDPEYQRLFRWDEEKQSRLIETLILEMPVPPIYVVENQDGIYELIDGLQRISSYLNFRGVLKEGEMLKLKGCDIVPEINGLTFNQLPLTIQIKIKRNFVRVEILRQESDSKLKYYMFKRLNTGGESLSAQEIRNCTIRLLNNQINDFIIKMSNNDDFKETIKFISSEDIDKKLDQELVLRFFALKNNLDSYYNPLDEFLTEYMEKIAKEEITFNYAEEELIFKKTFEILNKTCGDGIFSTYKDLKNYENFVVYFYDTFILGIQKRLSEEFDYEKLNSVFNDLKSDGELYRYRTGSLSNIKKRKEIVEQKIEELYGSNK